MPFVEIVNLEKGEIQLINAEAELQKIEADEYGRVLLIRNHLVPAFQAEFKKRVRMDPAELYNLSMQIKNLLFDEEEELALYRRLTAIKKNLDINLGRMRERHAGNKDVLEKLLAFEKKVDKKFADAGSLIWKKNGLVSQLIDTIHEFEDFLKTGDYAAAEFTLRNVTTIINKIATEIFALQAKLRELRAIEIKEEHMMKGLMPLLR